MLDTGIFGSNSGDISYGDSPSILLLSNDGAGADAARLVCEAAGARICGSVPLDQAQARLDTQMGVDAIMVELDGPDDPDEALLDRLGWIATREAMPTIVAVPLERLDAVAARLGNHVELICQPSLADRVASLGLALGEHRLRFNDITTDVDPNRLRKIADEVSRIAQALARLTPEVTTPAPAAFNDMMIGFAVEPVLTPIEQVAPIAADIRTIIRLRRLREQFFDKDLFADPAWDMLLDLMAARLEHKEVAVSSLCIAASVPPTTALRWIKTMSDNGMFERCSDPDDGRRIFIRLSDRTSDALLAYLAAAKKIGGLVV